MPKHMLFLRVRANKGTARQLLAKTAQILVAVVFVTSQLGASTSTVAAAPSRTGPQTARAAPLSSGTMTPACGGGVFPCSVWGTSGSPATPNQTNSPSIELGVKFRTDVNGEIQGIRFYKGSSFSGDFTGHLWDTSGTLLATTETLSFSGDASTGWKEMAFPAPYPVSANTTYVASFFSSAGWFGSSANSAGFLDHGVDSPPLHILKDGADGSNGVFNSGSSAYPASSWGSSNYWVDVMFYTSQLTVTGVSPVNGASGVPVTSSVTASFSDTMDPATITSSTFTLLNGSAPVDATFAYDDSSHAATLTPTSPLGRFTYYTVTVKGGGSGVKTPSGGTLAADYSWSFTTESTAACTGGVYPCSIWGSSGTPASPLRQDGTSRYELGTKFKSSVDGLVRGIRFYKGAGNTGAHYGHVWAASGGAPLASVLFTNETPSGWQEATFDSPLMITAGTTYIVSYYSVDGWYAQTNSFFTSSSVVSDPLTAPQSTVAEPNGVLAVCAVSTGCFPNLAAYMDSNYWADVIFDASMTLSVSNVTPASGSQYLDVDGVVSGSFSQDMVADSLASHFTLGSAGGPVPATVTLGVDNRTATLTPSSPLASGTIYTATITGGSGGVQATSGATLSGDYTWTFTTVAAGFYPISIWSDSAIPGTTSTPDTEGVELGVKFRSDVAGYITGIRFYKGTGNAGTHYGHLWTTSGTKLAEVAFMNETSTGWQTMLLPAPVAIQANTTYVASYYSPVGHWSVDRNFFTSTGVDHAPLHAPISSSVGGNGAAAYPNPPSSTGTFPSGPGYLDSNYWVDVVFNASLADHTAPEVTYVSPADGASHVRTTINITATFSESVTGTTDAGNFTLSSGSGPVDATVTYNDSTHTATLTPTSPLAYSTAYTVLIKGGPSGVKDLATPTPNPMATDKTWSFTTGAEPPPPHPNMKAVVLVNSASPDFADFQHFIQPYLDNFGIPYDVCDVKTECQWASIGDYALIIIGHRQIDPSGTYLTPGSSGTQSDLTAAVEAGSGLVNFDNDLANGGTPRYEFVRDLFGFAYDSAAHAGSGVTFLTQPAPHYITQRHANGSTINTGSMTLANIVSGANATRLAGTGSDWLLSVSNTQRAVQFGTYNWMSASVKGPVFGLDDLVWRSMVWAARKPFAMQGLPPFATFRVDDVQGTLGWVHVANEVGFKPWLGMYPANFPEGSANVADLASLVTSGNATTSLHAFAGGTFMYFDQFDTQGLGTPSNFPDSVIAANFVTATNYFRDNGIPIAKFVLAHYYGTGDNIFGSLPGYPDSGLDKWGVEFIGVEHRPGTNAVPPWLQEGPYRLYENVAPDLGTPVYYADYLSVPNHPELDGKFFNCFSEMRDIGGPAGYDWLPTSSDLPGAISTGTQWFTRGFDGMTLATLFLHEQGKALLTGDPANWRTIMQGIAGNIAPYHPRYVTLDYACQYLRAMHDSTIEDGVYDGANKRVTVDLSGKTDMPTQFYLFTDDSGAVRQSFVDVPTFDISTQVQYTIPGPLDHVDITPNPASVVAGATQQFTATAKDTGGNTINDPDLTFTWSVANGGGTIGSTGLFTAGFNPGTYANTVTATTAGKTGYATVNVVELVFDHFSIEPISSPQYVGLSFQVGISARDSSNNLVVTYNGNPGLVLADTTGTLAPTATGIFANGLWSGYVTINQEASGDSISASNGTESATSNAFDAGAKPVCPCKIWPTDPTPSRVDAKDPAGATITTGTRFRSEVDGHITGVRYYKGSADTGSHTGRLWTNTGTLLATVSFTNETSSGWQEATFSTPVPILANRTYVVSVYSSSGYYVQNTSYFTTAVNTPPLHALMSGTDGPNGVSIYDDAFPTETYMASNYWIDVVFNYNDAPVAVNDAYNTNENVSLSIPVPGVLGNDTDAEPDPLTAVKVTDPAHGTLTLNTDGSFTYTPGADWSGTDSFTYKANDGLLDSNTAMVTIAVTATTHTISGNAGVAGATLSGDNGGATVTADQTTGTYSLTVSHNWSGTVTPSKAGYTFTPTSRTYSNVTADLTGENYTAQSLPMIPSSFYGEIHVYDNAPIVGDHVDAYIEGVSGVAASASITSDAGTLVYSMNVPGDVNASPEGKTITFKINGRVVGTAVWHSGTNVRLDFHPPEALPGGPYSGAWGTAISFAGSANDWGSDATTYQWDWDNNGTYDETGQNPNHTWPAPGSETVGLKVTDAKGGEGTATVAVTVGKASATVTLSNLTQIYDGTPKPVTVNTVPSPLTVDVTYDGSATAPINPGSYAVVATVNDANYAGSASGTLVILATHSISLVEGWNLVSFNVHPVNADVATVLSSIAGKYTLVYAWDAGTGNWVKYDPTGPGYQNSLSDLNETMGFWIRMNSTDTLNVAGSLPQTTDITLRHTAGGWNLVGYPSAVNRSLPDALSGHGVGTDFSLIYTNHAADTQDPWKLYDRLAPAWANDLTQFAPGWGYWVMVSADHTWSVGYAAP